MSGTILVEREDHILNITVNRPEEGNILTDRMVSEIGDAVMSVPDACKIIVLKGAGADFCLGRDLKSLNLDGPIPEALALRSQNDVIFRCYNALRTAPVPVVAIVQGRARGFGCALAGAADITIAAEDAIFQLPEMGHGVMPGMAMSALVDRVPKKAFLHLVLAAMPVNAQRALAIGLVSDIAPAGTLDAHAGTVIQSILRASRLATQAVKQYAAAAGRLDMQTASDLASNLHATLNSSSELRHH